MSALLGDMSALLGGGTSTLLGAVGPSAYWYTTRATGAVGLILLTLGLGLGVVDVRRFNSSRYPRFLIDALHRNVSLLGLVFVLVHILTAVLDSFAPISLTDAVIPFVGSYRPFWLGLGTVSFDLMLAVIVTSLMRRRLGFASWRAVHWLSYACWPFALLHGFGTGSDVKGTWLLVLSVGCLMVVLAAVLVRIAAGWPQNLRVRWAALAGAGGFTLGLLIWLPSGPLGKEWARRSGTPSALLGKPKSARPSGSTQAATGPRRLGIEGALTASAQTSGSPEPADDAASSEGADR